MPRLVESLSRFFGRVEIFALGLEGEREAAEAALAKGQPLEARDHARALLAELPGSPLGLALWADAAEDAWLDHEVIAALSKLAEMVPWRADVWLRLGRAGLRTSWTGAREALERAAVAQDEPAFARLALLDLSDLDLRAGDAARAARWLDRIPMPTGGIVDRDASLRRAECALALGDVAEAEREAERGLLNDDPVDGREALVKAKLALARSQPGVALDLALRAFLLDTDGAGELVAALVAQAHDVVVVDRVRRVLGAATDLDAPAWAAAFAFAEGRRDDARRALERGLSTGDRSAASALLALATETRDLGALDALADKAPSLLPKSLATIRKASALAASGKGRDALDKLDRLSGDVAGWAASIRASIIASWLPEASPAAWSDLLAELGHAARALERMDQIGAIEALAVERERPLRLAVVGEFNAGKSTFLNALLGEDVAPTGVLPTTATLHWVAWAPDPFARIAVHGAPDRVVPHDELKATLSAITAEGARVERVHIYAPIERLKRVEVIDTPGFNAPDPDHLAAARQAFEEAHVAIWLLDATHPLKESERRVLAEVQGLGVPVQILANKADRLKQGERERVMDHVREGLAAVGLSSYAEPIAFSAKLSLKGKLGDADALAASGWSEVEALLAERFVDASERLKERALRRRAARIASSLAESAIARAEVDQRAVAASKARRDLLLGAAAKLRREKRDLAPALASAIEPARRALSSDLRPLGALPIERQRTDAGLGEYLRERFVARLTDPLLHEIASVAKLPRDAVPARAGAVVRAVLLGAVAATDTPAELVSAPIDRVIEAVIEAYAAALTAVAEAPITEAPSAALARRVEALRDAFSPSHAGREGDHAAVIAGWLKRR